MHARHRLWLAALAALLGGGCAARPAVRPAGILDLLARHADSWNEPVRLTQGPGAQYNADYSPRRAALVYVSDRDGAADLFLRSDLPGDLAPPEKLAPHSARDRWPRFSPDGRRIAFVSHRLDGGGDLYVLRLGSRLRRPSLRRLTGAETADDQPCWHPDGERLFYAASPTLDGPFDLYELKPGAAPVRLTERGGLMPDCSPDGRWLAFVSPADGGDVDLWLLRLRDRRLVRLTSGPEVDLHPCWSADGRRVLFSRVAYDTNRDGAVDGSDASALFGIALEDDDPPRLGPPRQLTACSASAGFPRPLPGGVVFTRGLGGGGTDVFALGESGEAPAVDDVEELLAFARLSDVRDAADPHRRVLAWQNVLWAARTAGRGADDAAALAGLEVGHALVDAGLEADARRAFERLEAEFPPDHWCAGRAAVERLALARRDLEAGARRAEPAWDLHAAEVEALEGRFGALLEQARVLNDGPAADRLEQTCALIRLERGYAQFGRGDYAGALAAFDEVARLYPTQREAGARALLAAADVHGRLGRPEAARNACLALLKQYPEQDGPAATAAARVVGTIVRPDADAAQRLSDLREMIERYADVPVLPALAQNYIGDLHYAQKDYLRAAEQYARTIERFPGEATQVAAAYLSIGRIRTEQQDYGAALDALLRMQAQFDPADRLYRRARTGYVSTALLKAAREFDLGDVQLALGSYRRLLDFDPGLAAAHRGLVGCYARLGRVDDAVLAYRPRVAADPRDHVARYALALAYSYWGPTDWVGNRRAARARASVDRQAMALLGPAVATAPDVPYYHQLRGFLLSRLALTTDEDELRAAALDAYMRALGLSSAEDDPANYPNVLFNVGEGYSLLGQPENAYPYYRRAMRAGLALVGRQGEAALSQIGRSALAAGDYGSAAETFGRALALMEQMRPEARDAAWHRRRAEALDRLALARHLDGDYAGAAAGYRRYAAAVERLIEQDPKAAASYRRNLLRAHRNLAVNLCLAVEEGQADAAGLREAYDLLTVAVERLDRVGAVEWERAAAPGLITIDIGVALGESKEPEGFDAQAERRLLHTYMARLSAAAGDRDGAVAHLRRKLALYPPLPADTERTDLLTEQAVVWTQIGEHEAARGDDAAAAQAFGRACELDQQAGNVEGAVASALSFGRAALRAPDELTEARSAAVELHRTLLERPAGTGDGLSPAHEAALRANLSALLDRAATLTEVPE